MLDPNMTKLVRDDRFVQIRGVEVKVKNVLIRDRANLVKPWRGDTRMHVRQRIQKDYLLRGGAVRFQEELTQFRRHLRKINNGQ